MKKKHAELGWADYYITVSSSSAVDVVTLNNSTPDVVALAFMRTALRFE